MKEFFRVNKLLSILTIVVLLILIILLMRTCCSPTQQAAGRKFYIKVGGNDNADGLSDATAWATIGKVNDYQGSFQPGDSIVFKGGDTFSEMLTITKSGSSSAWIYYGSYGGGKATFSGLKTVTGWVSLGGNIWEAPTSGVPGDVNLVLRNGTIQQVGRYPNTDAAEGGYLTYTSSTTTSITGSAMSSTTNWTGAEVAIRPNRWEIVRREVNSHSGGTVNFDALDVTPKTNYGYFFQRDARTLDRDGEFFQNGSTNKMRMYFSNNNPNAYTIQASTIDTLIYTTRSYLTFENLSFTGANDEGIICEGGNNIKINNCDASKMGRGGFSTWFVNTVTVTNCTLTDCLSHGIRVHPTSDVSVNVSVNVNDNIVRRTALFAGMEVSDISSGGNAIFVRGGSGVNCLRNIITNSGYNAINWLGDNVRIANNYIDSVCSVRDDGGGIYIYQGRGAVINSNNRNIVSNVILNGIGNDNGTPGNSESSVVGVYVDEGTRDVLIDSNTIGNFKGNGIHGNDNGDITATHNTIFNCIVSVSFQRLKESETPIRGMRIENNILYPYRFRYRNLAINIPSLITKEADLVAMGTLDNNIYSTRSGTDTSITTVTTYNTGNNYEERYYPFSYLTGLPQETHSTKVANDGELYYNETAQAKTINFAGLSKKDVYGTVYNNSVTIPGYSSKILLDNGVTNRPPTADAGPDVEITLPTNSATLTGSGSDAEGSVSFQWSIISGAGGTLGTPTQSTTTISGLSEGTYIVRLTVTDQGGLTATNDAQVSVYSGAANQAPVVNAGSQMSIYLPITSTTLIGSGVDPDGTIVSFTWEQISGPVIAAFQTPYAPITNVYNLITPGTYLMRLTATDNRGATSSDEVEIIVYPIITTGGGRVLVKWKI